MLRPLAILTLLLAAFASAFAQIKWSDSLRRVLSQPVRADTERVNQLNEFAFRGLISEAQRDSVATLAVKLARQLGYARGQARALYILNLSRVYSQPKAARNLLGEAFRLAQSTGDKALQSDILRLTGISYFNEGSRALPFLQRAVTIAQTTHRPALLAPAMEDLGTYYAYRSISPPSALNWYFQALRAAERAGSAELQMRILQRIAGVYIDLTDYNEALRYLHQILNRVGPDTKSNQILALADVGKCYLLMGQYGKAIASLRSGLTLSGTYKERLYYHQLPLESLLADAYEQQGNALALPYARRVLMHARQQQADYVISRVSVTLGRYYLRTGQADSAIYYGQQAIRLSHEDQNKIRLRDASQILAGAYAQRRDFVVAYAYQSRYLAYKDSINNEEITRRATAMRLNDQMSRQQNQIALLTKDRQLQAQLAERQRLLLYATLAVLALIVGLLAVLYRNNRNEQRANALLQRQKTEIQNQRDQTQQALTELRAAQAQLVQREKMASLGELTAGIAHEIQNPLNFVNNFTEVSAELLNELSEEQQKAGRVSASETELLRMLKSNFDKIHHHGQRAAGIVRGMLEHARTTTGNPQPTDLNALCEEYLRLAYQGYKVKNQDFNCSLITRFDATLRPVNLIPQELSRVLLNLFNNAFYAVQERQRQDDSTYQPVVCVSTVRTPGAVEIHVSDNGTGMPDGVRQRIYQPFFTTKPTGQGTGLGLSLSYDIITKGHGGRIEVTSQEGRGTDFAIWLPVPDKRT